VKRRPSGEWLFPVLFLGLLLVGYGLVPLPESREKTDSFAVSRGGKKVFFDLASRLLPDVRRSSGALIPDDAEADVLVLLGPARYPDRSQWQTLHGWISEGRALIFAAKWEDPAVNLEPFGIEVVPAHAAADDEEEDDAPAEEPAGLESELAEEPFEWRSDGAVRYTDPNARVLVWVGGVPQVVWQPVGSGVIVVAASDFVFSNLSLIEPANAVAAFRILEQGAPAGPVYFDEAMNEAGAPEVVGILFDDPLRLPTLQLLLVTLLFAWMASRRFGPLARTAREERRSLVEHAEALGSLHYKVKTGAALLGSYLEYFLRELGLAYRVGPRGRTLLDVRGRSKNEKEIVARAIRSAKSPTLEPARVAEIIRSLALLRAETKRGSLQPERRGPSALIEGAR
jgi:hypothetical protein